MDLVMSSSPRRSEILIAGAGPAGLFAALGLASSGYRDITVIDAGPDIGERRRDVGIHRHFGGDHPDYEKGVGGAGLFSDGKLCLSLDVGGHLETSLGDGERRRLLSQIEAVFRRLADDRLKDGEIDRASLERTAASAQASGLTFKHYDVAHIGTDRCGDVVAHLRNLLAENGVAIWPKTELLDLWVESKTGDKIAVVRKDDKELEIRAQEVVLALGKVGADRQAALCRNLGVELKGQPIYVGVRFEAAADPLMPLFAATKDPKYSIALADGSKVKTHCASEGGEVIELRYSDLPLAGGHNFSDVRTSRSGFSILWNGYGTEEPSYEAALGLMRRASELGHGRLLVQRLHDYREARPSKAEDIANLELSCPTATAGDLRRLLPAEFFLHMDLLLERLDDLVPGFVDSSAVIYGPAIEWWMERVIVDGKMRTSVPGLSACGDGSGWSQGIVHAAATGLLAAEGIIGRQADVARFAAGRKPTDLVAV